MDGTPDIDVDTDIPDLDVDVDVDGTPDIDVDTDVPDLDVDVDVDGTPDVEDDKDGDGDDDNVCPISQCWAECVDDLNTDGYCFDRTPLPSWCPSGTCCLSEPIPCPDVDVDIDAELDVDVDATPDIEDDVPDVDVDGTPDGDVDADFPDLDIDVDVDGTPDVDVDLDVEGTPDGDVDADFPDLDIDVDVDGTPDGDGDGDVDSNTCTEYIFEMGWGVLGTGPGEFDSPQGIGVSPSGFVYTVDYNNNRIQKFTVDGTFIREINHTGFTKPRGITVLEDGTYFVTGSLEVGGHSKEAILEFNSEDTYVDVVIDLINPLESAMDVALLGDKLYVADSGSHEIFVFTHSDGTWTFNDRWDVTVAGDANTPNPRGVAVDSAGVAYVADYANNKVKKFYGNGVFIGSWTVGFNSPWDVFVDKFDWVYVADYGNHRVMKFSPDGALVTSFGSYGPGDGEFNGPAYVFEDGYGNAYVSDSSNNRVQLWTCNHSLCSPFDEILDVANDTSPPWEWNASGVYQSRERVWSDPTDVAEKINGVLRRGCLSRVCLDCLMEEGSCLIPFSFRTMKPASAALTLVGGGLSADDINFSYWVVDTIAEVPYGRRLRFSEGGNWTVRYDNCTLGAYGADIGYATYLVPPDADCGSLCFNITYLPLHPPGNPPDNSLDAHDAIDDAMYRLLDLKLDVSPKDGVIERLDVDRDGTPETCFDPEHMWFEAKDELGIQSLWGPESAKLIVWG